MLGTLQPGDGVNLELAMSAQDRFGGHLVSGHVDGVVTLVDGEALAAGSPVADREALERQRREDPSLDHITAIDELFRDQLQAADLVLLSRADRLSQEQLDVVQTNLQHQTRPGTALLPVAHGAVDTSVVLGLEHHSNEQVDHHHHDHDHTTTTTTTTITAMSRWWW